MKIACFILLPAAVLLTACDQVNQRLGVEDPAKKEARQDGEGRAVGSACRQSGRAIEDCYAIYYWLPKASIFGGWREMNDYMLANKLEVVQPRYEPPGSPEEMRRKRKAASEEAEPAPAPGATTADTASKTAEAGAAPAKADAKSAAGARPTGEAKPAAKP